MGKFDGVLLASDFDDTLYASTCHVSQENKDAIAYFMANGGYFSVATGRAHATFAPQIAKEGLEMNAPCVLSNGAGVYDFAADRWLYETFLRPEVLGDLKQLQQLFPSLAFETYHGDDIFLHNPNIISDKHMARVGTQYQTSRLEDVPPPWLKVILEQDHPILQAAQQYVLDHWGEFYEVIFSNRYLLELTRKGSHKGGMVTWIANYLGVAPENVYCVGDNANDLPMLAVSAIPFAPENATDQVKATQPRLVSHCDQNALADIVGILDGLYP